MNFENSITMTLAFGDAENALRAYETMERLAAGLFAAGECTETRVRIRSDDPDANFVKLKEEANREMCEEEEEFHLRFQSEHDFNRKATAPAATAARSRAECQCEDCGGEDPAIWCTRCQCELCGGTAPAYLHCPPPEIRSGGLDEIDEALVKDDQQREVDRQELAAIRRRQIERGGRINARISGDWKGELVDEERQDLDAYLSASPEERNLGGLV